MRAGRGEKDLDSQLEREKDRSKGGSSGYQGGGGSSSSMGTRGKLSSKATDPSKLVAEQEQIAATPFLKAQTGREIAILCEQNS